MRLSEDIFFFWLMSMELFQLLTTAEGMEHRMCGCMLIKHINMKCMTQTVQLMYQRSSGWSARINIPLKNTIWDALGQGPCSGTKLAHPLTHTADTSKTAMTKNNEHLKLCHNSGEATAMLASINQVLPQVNGRQQSQAAAGQLASLAGCMTSQRRAQACPYRPVNRLSNAGRQKFADCEYQLMTHWLLLMNQCMPGGPCTVV
jgi:hypothetical protein